MSYAFLITASALGDTQVHTAGHTPPGGKLIGPRCGLRPFPFPSLTYLLPDTIILFRAIIDCTIAVMWGRYMKQSDGIVVITICRFAHLSMIDWHSFLQVKRLPRRNLRGPPTSPPRSPLRIPVRQSGSSFTKDRMDRVAPVKRS